MHPTCSQRRGLDLRCPTIHSSDFSGEADSKARAFQQNSQSKTGADRFFKFSKVKLNPKTALWAFNYANFSISYSLFWTPLP